jgi:hypothetical protein
LPAALIAAASLPQIGSAQKGPSCYDELNYEDGVEEHNVGPSGDLIDSQDRYSDQTEPAEEDGPAAFARDDYDPAQDADPGEVEYPLEYDPSLMFEDELSTGD